MIQIKNLSKKYNNQYVLKNINLSLPSKGLIGISGESGSGETIFYINEILWKENKLMINKHYVTVVESIKEQIRCAKHKAILNAN